MKILITGGAGFVGSNLAIKLKEKYAGYDFICLDNLKRNGSELNLPRLKEAGIQFIHGDVRNAEDLKNIPAFDMLIDACAEPSVLAGVNSPVEQVINNNLLGTFHCLELAKKYNASFVFLSTSRVYPIALLNDAKYTESASRFSWSDDQPLQGISSKGINELFPLYGSRSFYGFTKFASEQLIAEYNYYFNMNTVINRCGVIAGPWQMGKVDQGVLVFWLAQHFWKNKLKYIGFGGTGKQVRDILYIDDLVDLIDYEIHHIKSISGNLYNVGGGTESSISLCELTELCRQVTGNKIEVEESNESRPGDIRIYVTDNSRVTAETGWKPSHHSKDIVVKTFEWMKDNNALLKNILS